MIMNYPHLRLSKSRDMPHKLTFRQPLGTCVTNNDNIRIVSYNTVDALTLNTLNRLRMYHTR
jgi:hypothetical protein